MSSLFDGCVFRTELERLFAALYVTSWWYDTWERYKDDDRKSWKRLALLSKMHAVVKFDRIMAEKVVPTSKN